MQEPVNWAVVAFDGWFGAFSGAVVGAIVSLVVALLVVHRTHRSDRDVAMEQARIAAFAELGERLLDVHDLLGLAPGDTDEALTPVFAAWHRWTMYVPASDDEFTHAIRRGMAQLREKAEDARRGSGSRRLVQMRFDALGGSEDVAWIIHTGREWHLHEKRRPEIEASAVDRFPRREKPDPDGAQGA